MLQGDTPADAESRAKALQVVRGAMSLLNMVAAVLPDAAADQLEVILQVGPYACMLCCQGSDITRSAGACI